MKSDFILAFNEIAETRKLPREVVLEALKAALASAYRRYANLGSAQHIEVRIDERTGQPSIWVEREVVESVESESTEVTLEVARQFNPDAQLGDMVLVEDTPEDFGRIAAQTAKQVILQRMREAEREAQYQEYMERVGDLVTGTVQSISGDVVTISLGRTEAILPRSQQVPGERYRIHEKVRAYVMEVKKQNRGPQIVVSRTHRNMLRRLLEYEVPEIYNGTVEIKSIAREPGARSKVAVAALQPGADPVGACVGMRGVRIQSIVKELGGEKIDVIEWSPDQAQFISKALSPARVSAVFLDDDPDEGRTATVIVPDDQLSLAIGREGQNARLAAKLTGWRIDIKSVSESAQDALRQVQDDPTLAEKAGVPEEMLAAIEFIMEKKQAGKPIMPEDYHLMLDFLKIVETYHHARREGLWAERRAEIEEARAQVPAEAYQIPLDVTDLPLSVYNLVSQHYSTAGALIEQYYVDPSRLLAIPGLGEEELEAVRELAETIEHQAASGELIVPELEAEAEFEAEPQPEAEAEAVGEMEIAEELPAAVVEVVEPEEEAVLPQPAAREPEWYDDDEIGRRQRAELVRKMADQLEMDIEIAPEMPPVEPSAESPQPAESRADEEAEEQRPARRAARVRSRVTDIEELEEEPDEAERARREKQLRRQLVYDEELGRVVSKRRRKRKEEKWDDLDDLEDY
ncbi:MAG: hypothetical protein Kow00124_05910 [Anaerolineae bacterium]